MYIPRESIMHLPFASKILSTYNQSHCAVPQYLLHAKVWKILSP